MRKPRLCTPVVPISIPRKTHRTVSSLSQIIHEGLLNGKRHVSGRNSDMVPISAMPDEFENILELFDPRKRRRIRKNRPESDPT